ncbi:hypothetical protein B0I72DRAFT_42018 [Yarrowia lipolytica]|uniref:Uncharacterized protein n=1 Tax=Yarrowia lipolytica TaxID=4952 RepID=A0A371C5P3_YARLL|nr:hypothetical protein B0I71DRAFT_39026 [Yarrowia lipolytica]RDW31905.1 hypothetical protein B0I72DRAFT_42018 [Yarrowia lipolytica]
MMIVVNSAASTNLKSPLVPLIRQQRNRLQRTSWYQSASQRHSLHSSSIHHPPPSPTRLVPLVIVQHLQAKISLFNSPKLTAPNRRTKNFSTLISGPFIETGLCWIRARTGIQSGFSEPQNGCHRSSKRKQLVGGVSIVVYIGLTYCTLRSS